VGARASSDVGSALRTLPTANVGLSPHGAPPPSHRRYVWIVRRSIHGLGIVVLFVATIGGGVLGVAQPHQRSVAPGVRTADAADWAFRNGVGAWVRAADAADWAGIGVRAAHAGDVVPPGVGQKAPEIRLGDQHGKTFVLGDAIKDKKFVVVAFYPKAFSGG
jgi:hypothetical protein